MSNQHKNPTISFRISEAERKQIEARILASGMMKKDYFVRSCIYNRICVVGKKETIYPLVETIYNLYQQLLVMQESAEQIFVKEELYSYIVHLVEKTRGNEYLSLGISPRGSIAILKMAKAHAFMQDRSYLVPEDIHRVFQSVCNHRLQLSTKAKASGFTTEDILEEILKTVPIPRLS